MTTDSRTLIVGGGLSGLALAEMLEAAGQDYLVLEARGRLGGRIKTVQTGDGFFDVGPGWFWPGQPRIAAMIARHGLEKFDQYADGDLMFEDGQGRVQRGAGYASMQGSWRLKGGLAALIGAIADRVPSDRLRINTQVTSLMWRDGKVTTTLEGGGSEVADRVVLAMPPRIAATINFQPALPDDTLASMRGVATWMAGQAKAVAVYPNPFWREAGLSGDAMSHRGPLVEIHDASTPNGEGHALFGFVGIPPEHRHDRDALKTAIVAQLVRLFGDAARAPLKIHLEDWAFNLHTSTNLDLAPLRAHPAYHLPQTMQGLWDGALHFSGTEVAPQFGGYIEGALEAAENTFRALIET